MEESVVKGLEMLKPLLSRAFNRIAEPRVLRIVQFVIYGLLLAAGVSVLATTPWMIREILGDELALFVGAFITLGAALGFIAVLPGVWWLERVGILSLGTGIAMYSVVVVSLGAPFIALLVSFALVLSLVQRWMEIRKYQLAPKRG